MPQSVAVLASGGGTNLQAIVDYFAARGNAAAGRVDLVISDRASAGALGRAAQAGIATQHVPADAAPGMLLAALEGARIDVVALAGYLRLVPSDVIRAYPGRIVNVHPALLPAFGGPGMYGRRVHAAVLEAGLRVTGATVHFVNEEYDRGAIVTQWPVPVRSDDTPESLGARVLRVEHTIYPPVVDALCAGTLFLSQTGKVIGLRDPANDSRFVLHEPDERNGLARA